MLLSIIVPVYNTEKYLAQCLDSLIIQDVESFEILCVNDGSTDTSLSILKNYQIKYPNLIKIIDQVNGGLGDARNAGLNQAIGTYIGFVDSDDWVDKDMYKTMIQVANEQDVIECDIRWVYPNKVRDDVCMYANDSKNRLLNLRVMVCNKLFKRELIEQYHIRFPVGIRYEDIPFSYQFYLIAHSFGYVPKPYYHYRQRDDSLSNHQNEQVRDIFASLSEVITRAHSMNLYEKYSQEIEYLFIRITLGSSFKRILDIPSRKVRNTILKENWYFLSHNFPNWKRNVYLKDKTNRNRYFNSMNSFTYKISSVLMYVLKGVKQ